MRNIQVNVICESTRNVNKREMWIYVICEHINRQYPYIVEKYNIYLQEL